MRMVKTPETVRLLEADPDLGACCPGRAAAEAERELTVRTYHVAGRRLGRRAACRAPAPTTSACWCSTACSRASSWSPTTSAPSCSARATSCARGRPATAPACCPSRPLWSVLSPLTVAVLDRRFAAEVARYPEITSALLDRMGERSVRLATTQAISQLTRVDRRLRALFWHLAERWGRVSGQGVIVPLALTHRILGQLVGARRPDGLHRAVGARRARGADPPARRLVAAARRPAGRADARPPALAAQRAGRTCCAPPRRFEREDERTPSATSARSTSPTVATDPGRRGLGSTRQTPRPRRHPWPFARAPKASSPTSAPSSAKSSSRCSRRPTSWRSRR